MVKKLKIVDCSNEYWEFVRELRNNPIVKSGFVNQDHIAKSQQKEYMKINSKNYKICLKDDIPVGYFGVIENDIRVCTLPEYQKQGIGTFMLLELKKIWPKANARIKAENFASVALFKKSGFEETFVLMENRESIK